MIPRVTLISSLLCLFLINACKSNHTTSNQDNNIPVKPRLLFLTYTIAKTSEGEFQANLINKIIVEGKLKESSTENKMQQPESIQCIQVNKNLVPIRTISMINPLFKVVEYVNENGQLSKKQIELDSTQFSIRVPLNSQSKFVILKHQNMTDGSTITLAKTEL